MKVHLKKSVLAAGVSLGILTSFGAQASLVLNIDTATKELWYTGTDSGTPNAAFGNGFFPAQVAWYAGSGGSVESFVQLGTAQIEVAGNSYYGGPSNFSYVGAFDGSGRVMTSLTFQTDNALTLVGTGLAGAFSYAGWGTAQQANLESYIGGNLPLGAGTGFGNLQVQAVPVPAAIWLFGSALAGLGVIGRRKTAA